MSQKSPFWNLLLATSCIAACVSLLTTGLGLARYLAAPLAWPLALAVQMGLFGLAWLIAVRQIKLRQRSAAVAGEIDKSLAEASDLELRLTSWLELEQAQGWTTSTCDATTHCYLSGVCDRVQGRIDSWKARFGQYPQGPGEPLIYGSLETEQSALRRIGDSLRSARQRWGSSEQVFAADLNNRERLRQFDLALADVPQRDLQAVRCEAVVLPTAPPYDQFARDDALLEEKPVYAFEDLAAVFRSGPFSRSDYPTVFALFLAVFIDLFVPLVAIGAAVVAETDPWLPLSSAQPTVPEWGEALSTEITTWIDGALLQCSRERRGFASTTATECCSSPPSRGTGDLAT